ncbi:MAG TPA: DUF418 domain-containing protein [Allosphingosinicella sp.]|nr:DUF418 domain-containing protein [Allosphingosinicella sp.]
MTATTLPPPRILTLDILRGVAVMGIFSVNVVAFAMPEQAYLNPKAYGLEGIKDLLLWALNFVLIDGKMRAMFSMLFGASLLLVVEKAEASGASPASIHYRRMFWLLIFGLVHYYLIWFGDILTLYALIGAIAFLFRRKTAGQLLIAALIFLALDFLLLGSGAWFMGIQEAAAHAPGASAQAISDWAESSEEFGPLTAAALARDLALYRGGYAGIVMHRLSEQAAGPVNQFIFAGPQTMGYMLLGMAGLKSGFLTGEWSDGLYRRIALLCIGVGALAFAFLGWGEWRSGFAPLTVFRHFIAYSAPFRPLMMIGYAALIILLARRGGALTLRIAAAGRAAFTNYLGTSLAASTIFYGYGVGLYGQASRLEAWLLCPVMWAAMLLWSKPWLDRYQYGPLEWLWRSLTRFSPQPMRRRAPA